MGSADARTIASHDPKTSMCATPTFVTTTTSGRAIAHRSATSPSRRAPSSATTTCTSGGAPRSVIGVPISLLNDHGLACVRNRRAVTAAVMSFVEVLPFAPVMPTTTASIPARSSPASAKQRVAGRAHLDRRPVHPRAATHERRDGATFERRRDERMPVPARAVERDEQRARLDQTGVGRDGPHRHVLRRRGPPRRRRDAGERPRLHARPAPSATSSSRATTRSSNATRRSPISW